MQLKSPGGFENLIEVDGPRPEPAAGEALIRWRATSLNFHDYLVVNGSIPVADGQVPMSDGAGEVVAVGEGVTEWRAGDRVMSLFFPNWLDGAPTYAKTKMISGESSPGFASEYSCVNADALTSIPDDYSFAEAATLPCAALTAWRALVVEGSLKAGESVLIQGSGGVSVFALQLAKALGAVVYATTSSDQKAARLEALGADEVVNYRDDEKWGKTVFKLSGGGVDHIVDIGGSITLPQSVEAIGFGGNIVLVGILSGRKGDFVLPKLFFKHAHLHGIAVGNRTSQKQMVKAINTLKIKPVLDRSFDLSHLADAFAYQESGRHFGKIVVEY